MHRTIPACAGAVLAVLLAGAARAGGVSHDYTRLPDAFAAGGRAVLLLVRSVDSRTGVIEGQVLQEWSRIPSDGEDRPDAQVQRFELLAGPATGDGREWVEHRHYWNDLGAWNVGVGQQVLVVSSSYGGDPCELVAATEPNIAKVGLVADSGFPGSYLAGATTERLEQDLGDFDLYDAAYAGLAARGELRDEAVFAAADRLLGYIDLLDYHLGRLPADRRTAFWVALARAGGSRSRARFLPRVNDAIVEGFDSSKVDLLLAMTEASGPGPRGNWLRMGDCMAAVLAWLQTPEGEADVDRVAPFVLAWIQRRSISDRDDRIPAYVSLLEGAGRTQFIVETVGSLQTSAAAASGIDDTLLGWLEEEIREGPDAAFVAPLGRFDDGALGLNGQEIVPRIVGLPLVLADAGPAARAEAAPILARYARYRGGWLDAQTKARIEALSNGTTPPAMPGRRR